MLRCIPSKDNTKTQRAQPEISSPVSIIEDKKIEEDTRWVNWLSIFIWLIITQYGSVKEF